MLKIILFYLSYFAFTMYNYAVVVYISRILYKFPLHTKYHYVVYTFYWISQGKGGQGTLALE